MFSSVHGLPSPTSAKACASLFGWFTGTTPQSDSSVACASAFRHYAFSDRPAESAGATEVSRFSCMLFLSVRRVYDYVEPPSASRFRLRRCGLPLLSTGSAPQVCFFAAQYPAHRCFCPRFGCRLATTAAGLEVRMGSLLLSCGALAIPDNMPVYPGARRGRDGHRWPPPARIRTGAANAYGSYLGYERQSARWDRHAGCGLLESTFRRAG